MKESRKSIQIFYCGDPIHSPFDQRKLTPEILEEGLVTPQAIPRSFFKMLPENKKQSARKTDPESEFGDCFDFVQVECGQKHTLLLNKQGAVFSFGEGLSGALGTNRKEIQQYEVT